VNRRDLLLLRTTPKARVLELSCQQLYLQYLDARRSISGSAAVQQDYWLGEPEPDCSGATPQALFDDLARRLAEADVLRLIGRDWLCEEELALEVDRLTAQFVARGGRIEFA
jgi:hypothetical protein